MLRKKLYAKENLYILIEINKNEIHFNSNITIHELQEDGVTVERFAAFLLSFKHIYLN